MEDDYKYVETSDVEIDGQDSDDDTKGIPVSWYSTMEEDFAGGKYYKKQYPDHLQCCQGMNILWNHTSINCVEDEQFYKNAGMV